MVDDKIKILASVVIPLGLCFMACGACIWVRCEGQARGWLERARAPVEPMRHLERPSFNEDDSADSRVSETFDYFSRPPDADSLVAETDERGSDHASSGKSFVSSRPPTPDNGSRSGLPEGDV